MPSALRWFLCGRRKHRGSRGEPGADIHRPAAVGRPGVHVQAEDEMLLGGAVVRRGRCVKKQRARRQIHDGRPGDTVRVYVAAVELGKRHRRAHVPLPDDAAVERVERIDVVGLRHGDDHRPAAGPSLDIERLGIDIADDRAVEIGVPLQTRRVGGREGGIHIKAVS